MSPHDSQAPGDGGVVEPKHQVFLSHSGAQKGFVWQLAEDLRSRDVHPFFDKDRDSLPIGENFPALILKAIKQCQVGVVILSEEFFSLSHWPMFELVEMVKCGRKIMPIFLGISPEDLSRDENLQRWRSKWQEWRRSKKRIDIGAWEGAVRLLRGLNGEVYDHAVGVVEFRRRIVKEIVKVVVPSYGWDDSHVQGRFRLSEILREKIAKTRISQRYGVQVVGIHGVGGIGKTTACKSLCKDLFMKFEGRVCHVELGSDAAKGQLERVQEVLKKLTKMNKKFLKEKGLDECWSLLKKHMHLKPVFLAIDNVLDYNSMKEAKKYLKLGYCQGSIVMVASRARGNLQGLKIDENHCHENPELDGNEAKLLFLDNAQPDNAVGDGVLTHCVTRCYFSKGDGSFHYHPLALKVLGSQLAGEDPKEWELRLREADVYNQRREQENGVYFILRSSFDALVDEDKLLFMDVALFDSGDNLKKHVMRRSGLHAFGTLCIFEWLRVVHGFSNAEAVKKRLDVLKKKSLLEELGDGTTRIGMHDLWREFAVMETKIGEPRGGRWVYEVVTGEAEESSLSGGGWKDLRRIFVRGKRICYDSKMTLKCLNFASCSKVTVLKLLNVSVENQALDLSALKQLKSLELVPDSWQPFGQFPKVSGMGLLTNLRVLIWLGIGVESASAVEEISCLTNLEVLQLSGDHNISPVLDLRQLRWLREVKVRLSSVESILGLSSIMTDLRILDLEGCRKLRSCPGVGDVVGLEVLVLSYCLDLEELPDLQKLTKLRVVEIERCEALEAIPGFGSLVALQKLHAGWCRKLAELPDMSKLTKLEVLDLRDCDMLSCLPGLGNLVALRELDVGVQLVNELPDLGNVTQLRRVEINGMHEISGSPPERKELCWQEDDDSDTRESHVLDLAVLESVSTLYLVCLDHELSNLSRLTALKSLSLSWCNLERLPHMGKHMRLESLRIRHCARLRGWDGVGDRVGSSESETGVALHCDWTLPHLKELYWWESGMVELPDLSHFPRLRKLTLNHCGTAPCTHGSNYAVLCLANHRHLETLYCTRLPIAVLPDLCRFPRLKQLWIEDCDSLTSLTISGPLTALESISLERCSNMNALPSVDLFPRLVGFRIEKCGVQLNEQEAENLRARGFRYTKDWWGYSWSLNPDPSTNEIIPGSEVDCNAGVQLTLDRPNDVAGPSSREVAPSSSEFTPYDESITECAATVPIRAALQVGGSDTQELSREEIRCFGGCEFWDMLMRWIHQYLPRRPTIQPGL